MQNIMHNSTRILPNTSFFTEDKNKSDAFPNVHCPLSRAATRAEQRSVNKTEVFENNRSPLMNGKSL